MHYNLRYILITAVTFIACMIGLGIWVSVIYSNSKNLISKNNTCGSFPSNTTHYTLKKKFYNQVHWRYNIQEFSGYVQLICPTVEYDSILYVNDDIVGYIDGKILTTVSRSYINDCQGERLYTIKTGSKFQTIINSFKIDVSLLIKDKDNNITLGYVEAEYFFTDNIDIKNTNGTVVANLKKNFLSYEWTVNVYDINSPAADKLILSLLAGKRSFSDSYNSNGDQTTDLCNGFFWGVSWTLVALVSLIVLFILVAIGYMTYYYLKR
jgi:uncharacterized protein YxjI